MMRQTSYDV